MENLEYPSTPILIAESPEYKKRHNQNLYMHKEEKSNLFLWSSEKDGPSEINLLNYDFR